jgi:hypothetical protein
MNMNRSKSDDMDLPLRKKGWAVNRKLCLFQEFAKTDAKSVSSSGD